MGPPNDATAQYESKLREMLHKALPELDTTGSAEDWILVFKSDWIKVDDMTISDNRRGLTVPAPTWFVRVYRMADVDGRKATALAWGGLLAVGRGGSKVFGRPTGSPDPDLSLLAEAVENFARAWHEANPQMLSK